MSRVARLSGENAADFEHGLRCADCGDVMVEQGGIPTYEDVMIWEYRSGAAPLGPDERDPDQKVAWVWTLICFECAVKRNGAHRESPPHA